MKLVASTCYVCRKSTGTVAHRFWEDGQTRRDYFHPSCYNKFKKDLVELDLAITDGVKHLPSSENVVHGKGDGARAGADGETPSDDPRVFVET